VQSEKCGKPASLLPTLTTIARTLDISARFLALAVRGQGTIETADRLLYGWSRDIFRYASASLTAEGLEHIRPGRRYMVMSNHGSLIDIPALIATYPGSLRMVTKEELMRVPIWGRAMLGSGFIPINRHDRQRAIEQLELAKERLRAGVAVWIAPEGTRSRDQRLGAFKKGGFHLARQLDVEIIPTYVDSATALLPVDSWHAHYDVAVSVTYGRPIAPNADMTAQMAAVRRAILELSGGRLGPGE
jgi:1-acyl-sn-glycerol-3-phosphate acyltransferase